MANISEKFSTPNSEISFIDLKDGGYPFDTHFAIIVHTKDMKSAKKTIDFILDRKVGSQ